MVYVVKPQIVYVMAVELVDNSKLTKISCDEVGGTWTYNIDGDDGSNGFIKVIIVLIVKQVIQR